MGKSRRCHFVFAESATCPMFGAMDRFEDMTVFQTIARTGSISGAAAELDVAPSAVSRRLKGLEERLGVQLVHRTTRTLTLTPAGETYLTGAKDILTALDGLEGEVQSGTGSLTGRIRLTAPLSFGMMALPPVLDGFMSQNPDVELDLFLTDAHVDLVVEGFDLALRIGNLAASSLIAKKLCDVPIAVAGAPSLVDRIGPIDQPPALEGAPSVIYTNTPNGAVWAYDQDGVRRELVTRPVFRANNGDILRDMAILGHGMVCEPEFILAPAIESGALKEVLSDIDWGRLGLYAVYPPTSHMPVRLRAFIDHAARVLKR